MFIFCFLFKFILLISSLWCRLEACSEKTFPTLFGIILCSSTHLSPFIIFFLAVLFGYFFQINFGFDLQTFYLTRKFPNCFLQTTLDCSIQTNFHYSFLRISSYLPQTILSSNFHSLDWQVCNCYLRLQIIHRHSLIRIFLCCYWQVDRSFH
jgi:hypothetical protein